jgi:ABC-type proline/glycine betaine transport system substrate-binding protein
MARVESTTGWFRCVLGACLALATLASPGALALAEAPAATAPAEPAGCRIVRLSNIGWTDVTATTALFGALIRHLGYRAVSPYCPCR